EAGLANAETARLLGIADGSPVFLFSAPLTSRADKRSNTSSPHFAVIATRLRTGWANSATTILPGVRHEHTGVCKRSISIAKSKFEQGVNHVGRKRGVFRSGCLLGASPLGCRPNQVGDPNSGARIPSAVGSTQRHLRRPAQLRRRKQPSSPVLFAGQVSGEPTSPCSKT